MITNKKIKHKTIDMSNVYEYGSATNGWNCGNGYDVAIKRISKYQGILNITHLSSGIDWLGLIDLDDKDKDLKEKAISIGNGPSMSEWTWDMVSDDEDEWVELLEIWNNIKFF